MNDNLEGMLKAAIVAYFSYYPSVYLEGHMNITFFRIDNNSLILRYRPMIYETGKAAFHKVKYEHNRLRTVT
jgi:hypothetical protein